VGKDWEITELDLDPPKAGEILVRFVAVGLCHSDDHLRTGDIPVRYPIVGGHEGAGIVEETGGDVTRFKPGDHVVCSFLPVCGHCRFCARGMSNLYRADRLKLDELVTTRYRLEDVNQGYRDLLDGRNIRGVLIHEH
jgi:S-(hydroxymethyl)glutathione dehydrogenase/alcohol dehydrogenase